MLMKIELLVSDKMIRNEDYEASAPPPSYDTATGIGKMGEMKRGLLRQATKTEDEQVFGCSHFLIL